MKLNIAYIGMGYPEKRMIINRTYNKYIRRL